MPGRATDPLHDLAAGDKGGDQGAAAETLLLRDRQRRRQQRGAGMDTGPIVAQVAVPVLDDDDEETLTERIKEAERRQLVEQVGRLVREGWTITGRKVTIP